MHTKFPATVMILRVMANEGDDIPLHFLLQDLGINTADYREVLENVEALERIV